MRIEYICHSCLYIETEDTNLVIDPWFKGPAYQNQWQLFPKPVEVGMLKQVKNILFSHGHEDHLHEESLKELPIDAQVFYPYQWRTGAKKYFKSMGFNTVKEAVSFKQYKLSKTLAVTYIGFSLESVIVIEYKDKLIVNINDALNSHHQTVVDMFLEKITSLWPKIDMLFAGWSGAGYFPNTLHYKHKNDYEVGVIREQYFGNHLCKIIQYLKPKMVIPFAPGFVLLSNDKRWINEVKFPRAGFKKYYEKYFDENTPIKFNVIYPGDYFVNDTFYNVSPYYKKLINGSLLHTIDEEYHKEINEINTLKPVPLSEIENLVELTKKWLNINKQLYSEIVLKEIRFEIVLKNNFNFNIIQVAYKNGAFEVGLGDRISPEIPLYISTTSQLLLYSLSNEWGGDALTIGYGIDVHINEESILEKNIDIVSVRLITRYPSAMQQLKLHPLRALKYYLNNPLLGKLAIIQKFRLKNTINKFPFNERDHWITFTKCELCNVCNLPLLSKEFGESLTV